MDYKDKALIYAFSDNEIQISKGFLRTEAGLKGMIKLCASPKPDLEFDVFIPDAFPFTEGEMAIRFICEEATGYSHVNADNSICFHSPKSPDFKQRLLLEVELLKEWRDKYYIREEEDEQYEYLITPHTDAACYLFTDLGKDFKEGEFGPFKGFVFRTNNNPKEIDKELVFIQEIGSRKCQWGNDLMNRKSNIVGLFVFIKKEPVKLRRLIAKTWRDLQPYFSTEFLSQLDKIKKDLKKKSKRQKVLPLLIGYEIPGSTEIHWHIAKMDTKNIPIEGEKIAPQNYNPKLINSPINWTKTINGSYSRYFGRGKVCDQLTEARILIIGVGAVGSSLAKSFARVGVRNIALNDVDSVEPGNICRSEFDLLNINFPKLHEIRHSLQLISPHISTFNEKPIPKKLHEPFRGNAREQLEKYDFIFDCTSDVELSYILDKLELKSTIINLTISNKAKEMVCVVGGCNITKIKDQIFDSLNSNETKLIYEGVGCWSPTFEASHFDINALLHLAIKNIDYQFQKKRTISSFVIKTEFDNSSINLKTIDY